MNEQEIQSLIKQLKAAGLNDEQIMDTFYEAFESGEMDRKDLEVLAEAMGYELTDDFKNDENPDPIAAPEAPKADEAGNGEISKNEAEDLKEIKPGESPEEFKEKVDEAPKAEEPAAEEPKEDKPEEPKADEGDDDEKGWEEAQKKFKW